MADFDNLRRLIDWMHSRETDEEMREVWADLDAPARKVWLYLGRLYLERQMSPSVETQREINRIETAIRMGEALPDVPATH